MNGLNDKLAHEFEDHEYAHVYIQSHVLDRLAMQVHALRNQRGLNQTELAALSGIGQGKISKIETGDFESLNLKTLFKLAEALDVAPVVRFERFTDAIDDVTELQVGNLNLPARTDDLHARKRVRHLFSNPMLDTAMMDSHISVVSAPLARATSTPIDQGDFDNMLALAA